MNVCQPWFAAHSYSLFDFAMVQLAFLDVLADTRCYVHQFGSGPPPANKITWPSRINARRHDANDWITDDSAPAWWNGPNQFENRF